MKTTFMEATRDLMKKIRVFEGMGFRSSENISENVSIYFLKFIDGDNYLVMETANGWVSLNEWLDPQGCYLTKYEYEVPEVGTDGTVYSEKIFTGSFIDACKYLLFRKRKRSLARRRPRGWKGV